MRRRYHNTARHNMQSSVCTHCVRSPILLLSACFVAGAAAGSVIGALSEAGETAGAASFVLQGETTARLLKAVWQGVRFSLLSILLSFPAVGMYIIPAVSFVRGCFFSCAVSYLAAKSSVSASLVILGLPALFEMPCFLIISACAFRLSQSTGQVKKIKTRLVRLIAVCLALIVAGAVFRVFLMPEIVSVLE